MDCDHGVTVNNLAKQVQSLARQLELKNIMPTRQRLLVAQVLFNQNKHLTAHELYLQVNQGYRRVCRATVYNVLNVFVQSGIVSAIHVDGCTFYDVNTQPHHHFYNVDTGTLSDVPATMLPTQIDSIVPPRGTRLTHAHMRLVINVCNHPRSEGVDKPVVD